MLISILFFIIALLYATVGFGGGSSYIAVLALFEYPYEMIPILALVCNIIVVSGGAIHFTRKGHFSWSLFWPFTITSVPMAFLGGLLPISKDLFLILLGCSLLLAGLRLLAGNRIDKDFDKTKEINFKIALPAGGALGLLSGLVGIGGGIFLAPILLLLKWGRPKQVAATASMFIFINSLFGLTGQLIKHSFPVEVLSHWPLAFVVLVGGQIGSRLGAGTLISPKNVKDLTALLVMIVGLKIIFG